MANKLKPGEGGACDVHQTIREAAALLRSSGGVLDAAAVPELSALLDAAGSAVSAAVPSEVMHEGRTYWLRVRLAVQMEIFAEPGDADPLVCGLRLGFDTHGHRPGH